MKVLITGGAGYIGSTIAARCAEDGITPVLLDDYSTGLREFSRPYASYKGDIADLSVLREILREHPDIFAAIHCAAKIIVSESVGAPLEYYETNVAKSIILVGELTRLGVRRYIVSSTASIYASSHKRLIDELDADTPRTPYSASKWMLERIMRDYAATSAVRAISLRYFNPIGADPNMRCGLQDPRPTHALGKMIEAYRSNEPFTVTGVNWPTRDGSGLRDYLHVWDLAGAHVAALRRFDEITSRCGSAGFDVINIGTGVGTTVLELVHAFGDVTTRALEVRTAAPRAGDVVGCATRTGKATLLLDWKAELSIEEGIRDSLKWSEILPSVLRKERAAQQLQDSVAITELITQTSRA